MIFTLFVVRWITLLMVGMILHRSGKSVSVWQTVSVSVFTAEQSVIVIRVPERFQGKQLRGLQTSALFHSSRLSADVSAHMNLNERLQVTHLFKLQALFKHWSVVKDTKQTWTKAKRFFSMRLSFYSLWLFIILHLKGWNKWEVSDSEE